MVDFRFKGICPGFNLSSIPDNVFAELCLADSPFSLFSVFRPLCFSVSVSLSVLPFPFFRWSVLHFGDSTWTFVFLSETPSTPSENSVLTPDLSVLGFLASEDTLCHPPMIWHVADYHPDCCLGTASELVPRPTTITNPLRYRCESPGHFNVTSLDGPYPSVLRTPTTLAHYDPLIDRDLSK
jgi:hypothetical protein